MESEENENEVRCHYIVELPSEGEMVQYKINEEEVRNKVEIEKGLVPQFRRMELKRPLVIEEEEEERGKRIKMDKMGDEIWYAHEGKEKEEVVRRIEVKIKGVEKQSRKRVNVRRKKEKKGVCIQDWKLIEVPVRREGEVEEVEGMMNSGKGGGGWPRTATRRE